MKYLLLSCMFIAGCSCSSHKHTAAAPTPPPYVCTPVPHTNGTTIMPLGDSITYGADDPAGGGYRDLLARDLGPGVTFIGSMVDPQGYHHEGHPGWTTKNESTQNGLYENLDCWLDQSQPSIILLMIGTNTVAFRMPMDAQADAQQSISDLYDLINKIHQISPESEIYLASIVQIEKDLPWPGGNPALIPNFSDAIDAYNALIPSVVTNEQAAGIDIHFVDIRSAVTMDASHFGDMVHPNPNGYAQMEQAWLQALTR